jgi:hypothetical protein
MSGNGAPAGPAGNFNPPSGTESASTFYFYNPSTVAYGKLQFKKMWGNRAATGNWRLSVKSNNQVATDSIAQGESVLAMVKDSVVEKYTTAYYEKQIPKTQPEIDSIGAERNFAYYQLGLIYKEKFKEYELASGKLEQLLRNNPEEKVVLPAKYNLYKIYQITNPAKAESIKADISSSYPNSRYAQILNNTEDAGILAPEREYQKWYKLFEEEQFSIVLENIDNLINQYSGDEIVSKYALLKAYTEAKINGLSAYKNGLEEVADNYPNSEEGQTAREILEKQIPALEKLDFTTVDNKNWKILYVVPASDSTTVQLVGQSIKKFLAVENYQRLRTSLDKYTATESFVTVHGLNSEAYAQDVAGVLKEDKKYKVAQPAIIISSDNYKIIQIKKNIEKYLAPKTP